MASRKQVLNPLLDDLEADIAAAFLASIDLIRDVDFKRLVNRIAAGDVNGALDVLRLTPDAFAAFSREIASGFVLGGEAAVQTMPKTRPNGNRLVVRFDAANPEDEKWLRDHSSNAIREITEDQKIMVRNALAEGLAEGVNPRTMALDLVGRYDKKAGKRVGGLIGLTARQERTVSNLESALATGDWDRYFSYKLRDKSFDKYVRKAMKSGQPLPKSLQAKMVGRYKDRLLKVRGDTIGRTEAMAALHQGKYRAFAQAIEKGDVSADEVEREWQSAADSRVRESHVQMNGQRIRFYDKYTTPSGAKLLYPGDPNGPAAEIINCRCDERIRINFLGRLRR